jgi:UDP-2,3-diacylglucosamine pyrophosphatase LpxH
MTHYRTIFISDIHLGTTGCKADNLCKFLKENQCDNLFLVGDIIDGWKLSRGWAWPQSHSNVIRAILTKSKRGSNITYIVGNHDEFLRSWISMGINLGNIEIQNEVIYDDLKGRKWLITHGDLFDQVTRHWKFVSVLGDHAYTFLLMCNGWLHIVRERLGLGYWSLSQYMKSKTKQALNFIYKFEECLANHAKKLNMHGVICGHIHTPTIKMVNDIIYANDGDWVETCSALVETDTGEFHLLILSSDGTMEVKETY